MAKKKVEPDIASRIREAILSKGKKLATFSREAGMPYPSLMDYYNGTRKPGFDALATIVGYTGVNSEWLLTGKGNMFADGPAIQEQILAHIVQVLAYAQHKLQAGTWTVQEGSPDSYLYNIKEDEVRSKLNDMADLTTMAASIYNRVANIANESQREESIRKEVRQMLSLRQSFNANRLPFPKPDS